MQILINHEWVSVATSKFMSSGRKSGGGEFQESENFLSKKAGILRREKKTGNSRDNDFRKSAGVGCDDRFTSGKGHQGNNALRFNRRGDNKNLGKGIIVEMGEIRLRNVTGPDKGGGNFERRGESFEFIKLRAGTDENEF